MGGDVLDAKVVGVDRRCHAAVRTYAAPTA
jgi:hypothetical protein